MFMSMSLLFELLIIQNKKKMLVRKTLNLRDLTVYHAIRSQNTYMYGKFIDLPFPNLALNDVGASCLAWELSMGPRRFLH